MLGRFRLIQGDRIVSRFRTQKTAGILAYLAYHRNRSHPRETLAELFWPEAELYSGRHNLSLALSSLRAQLEPPGAPPGSVILANRNSVELNPEAFTTDVMDFEQALELAAQAQDEGTKSQRLAIAAEQYRGVLLPGHYEDWVLHEQARLAERFVYAVRALVEVRWRDGEPAQAIELIRRAIAVDPLREDLHAELMRLLAGTGQQAAALAQYRELERLLAQELAMQPSPAIERLARHLEVSQLEFLHAGVGAEKTQAVPSPPSIRETRGKGARPTGTVTFLLAEIEGATGCLKREPFRGALELYQRLLSQEFQRHGGHEVKRSGEVLVVAFTNAGDALACSIAARCATRTREGELDEAAFSVRMALHSGDVKRGDGEYGGSVLELAAQILSAAHGGQTLCSEATFRLLRRGLKPEVLLRDLGLYQLSGVELPERLFQVEYAGLEPEAFPPLLAERAYQGNLPIQVSRFFGRETEVEQLTSQLSTGSAGGRLITLTGPGGTGKTRLSLEVARGLLDAYAGSVWFVPLADVTDPRLVAEAVLRAVSEAPVPKVPPEKQVAEFLRRQPSLLILDNFEQLLIGPPVESASVEVVRFLLEQVPELRVLVTSRSMLNIPGESAFPVAPLRTPKARSVSAPLSVAPRDTPSEHFDVSEEASTPEGLSLYESVQLFIDRAQLVKPDFQVTNRNAPILAEICSRLEGIPLALELAAARAQVLTPTQMLQQLAGEGGGRFHLLVSRRRGVAERQRALRSTLDWSYRLLTPELQVFFNRLSVFRGGWSLEAAEAVCEEPLALDFLAQLSECSVIQAEEVQSGIRFRMLETLREYGREQLKPDERATAERRHAEYYLGLAERARSAQVGPEEARWLDRLEEEHDNLRAALDWSAAAEDGCEVGLRLCAALCRLWMVRGHLRAGLACCNQALGVRAALAPSLSRAGALRAAAILNCSLGNYDAAQALHEEGLALTQELGDPAGEALGWNGLGNVALGRCDYVAAFASYERSLALNRLLGKRKPEAMNLGNMALIANLLGRYDEAQELVEQALTLNRELGDRVGEAANLDNLANAILAQGNLGKARSLYEQALTLNRELGHREWAMANLGHLGSISLLEEDFEAARAGFAEALDLARAVGHRRSEATALNSLGWAAFGQGEPSEAREYFSRALTLARELGDRHQLVEGLEGSASLAASAEHFEVAASLWGVASGVRDQIQASLAPHEAELLERRQAPCRAALGVAAFEAAVIEGRRLPLEQALGLALQHLPL